MDSCALIYFQTIAEVSTVNKERRGKAEVLAVRMMDVEVVRMEEFRMDDVYCQCDLMPCFKYLFFRSFLTRLSHILFQISMELLCNSLFGLVLSTIVQTQNKGAMYCTVGRCMFTVTVEYIHEYSPPI